MAEEEEALLEVEVLLVAQVEVLEDLEAQALLQVVLPTTLAQALEELRNLELQETAVQELLL